MTTTHVPHRRLTHGRIALLAALAVLALAAVLAVSDGDRSAGAAGRTVDVVHNGQPVSATNRVKGGDVVTVNISGYDPGTVYVHQCKANATSWTLCAERTRVEAEVAADGTASIAFPVWFGAIPRISDRGIFGNEQVVCNATSLCDLFVSQCGFDLFADKTAKSPLFFTGGGTNPSPTTTSTSTTTTTLGVPPVIDNPPIAGGGASTPRKAVAAWQGALIEEPHLINVDYTTSNSPTGMLHFAKGLNDFALTTMPMDENLTSSRDPMPGDLMALNDTEIAELPATERGFTYVPLTVSALSIAHRFKITGIPVNDLHLSSRSLASMYKGFLTFINDPALTADNGGCRFPGGGKYSLPVMRTDRSGANLVFGSWLDATQRDLWQIPPSSSIEIDDSGVFGETGDELVTKFIDIAYDPPRTDALGQRASDAKANRLGFADQTSAAERHLQTARIQNAAGEFVLPSEEGVHKAIATADRTADGVYMPDFTEVVPGSYPLFLVTYAVVPTELSEDFPAAEADVMRTFLEYAISPEGQQAALDEGFYRMPQPLLDQAQSAIAELPTATPLPAVPTPTAEEFNAAIIDSVLGPGGLIENLLDAVNDILDQAAIEANDADDDELATESAAADSEPDDKPSFLAGLLGAATSTPGLLLLVGVGLLAVAIGVGVKMMGKRQIDEAAAGDAAAEDAAAEDAVT